MRSAHLALHFYAAIQVKMQSAFNKCILHAVKDDFNEILRLLLFRLLSTGQILMTTQCKSHASLNVFYNCQAGRL